MQFFHAGLLLNKKLFAIAFVTFMRNPTVNLVVIESEDGKETFFPAS